MPRYHFTLSDGAVYLDPEGQELASLDEARSLAAHYLADLLKAKDTEVWKDGSLNVVVADQLGVAVLQLTVHVTDPRLTIS